MWFKSPRMSEHDKEITRERNFRASVMAKISAVPASLWRKNHQDFSTGRPTQHEVESQVRTDTVYEAIIGDGLKVVLRKTIGRADTYSHCLKAVYSLTVNDKYVGSCEDTDDPETPTKGDQSVQHLYNSVSQSVKALEYQRAKPERDAEKVLADREHARRAAEEEKKRQDILRRL